MFLSLSVRLFVCLSVCPLDYSRITNGFLLNFSRVGRKPRNNRLDFGGDPDYDADPGFPDPDF